MIAIAEAQWRQVEPLLQSAARQVLTFYKLEVAPGEDGAHDVADEEMAGSVLGFTGERIRGSVTLTTTLSLLLKSHPLTKLGQELTEVELTDWLGELANQIVGRLKSDLCAQGAAISLSTPTCLMGRSLHRPGTGGLVFHLRVEGLPLSVELSGEIDPELVLGPGRPAPTEAPPKRRMTLL